MNCPHCQAPNAEDARFCGSCGQATSATEPTTHAELREQPVLIGREIAGRYRIQAKLGEGGMGAVFKAEQISLKRTIAVKLLRPEMASSQLLLRRFNAEAEAVAKLSHPNTVNIYDFGQDSDGTLFIAMEYVEGHSLRDVIHREAPFPLRRALSIALQVASSLTDAHSRSIIHRDLKPDNVMLQQRGRERDIVRVLDFGIAKLREENRQSQMAMTQAGDMLGTPQYMAPEQIRAEPIDGRTDVYALGCLLYEMITARLPYEAPTIMSLLSKHLLEVTVPPSQRRLDLALPPAIDQLILSAMAKDPNLRPATMEAFGEQMAELLASLPVDTMQATAQRAVPSSGYAPVVPTPAAYSAMTPSGANPTATYATHGPQMPAPAFAAPTAPPPQVPLPPMHESSVPTHHARGNGSNKALCIVLGVLLIAGGGVGIVIATRSTATSNDEWGGSAVIDMGKIQETMEDGEGPDVDGVGTPTPSGSSEELVYGIPPECERFAKMVERLAGCSMMPVETRTQIKEAADQMRDGYKQGFPASMRGQMIAGCEMGASTYEQMLGQYGCP
ncbi:MAG: protein kinase [Deltaproteobacteria bacterium]|nr:protein kinase [Deltaproteobacteria bacterium]